METGAMRYISLVSGITIKKILIKSPFANSQLITFSDLLAKKQEQKLSPLHALQQLQEQNALQQLQGQLQVRFYFTCFSPSVNK